MYSQALSGKRPSPQRRLRLAVIGSRGSALLRAGVCASAARKGLNVNSFFGSCSAYHDMLKDDQSDLYAFNPDAVLLAIDPAQLTARPKNVPRFSSIAKQHLGASIIQRTVLSLFPTMIDDASAANSHSLLDTMQRDLSARLEKENICLSMPEERSESGVLVCWSEPSIWVRRRQKTHSEPDLLDGNHVGRLLSAFGRLSYNILMLDISKQSKLLGYNLGVFLADRYGTAVSGRFGTSRTSPLDLLLLVDEDPSALKLSDQQHPVYTMRRQNIP